MTFVETLPIIINILLCILLIVSIIFLIKCIIVVDKADKLVDNVTEKVNTLNGLFKAIASIDRGLTNIAGVVFSGIDTLLGKIFDKKKEDK